MKVTISRTFELEGLGAKIREIRKKHPLSITKLAAAADMGEQNWYRIEQENQSVPVKTLRKVEEALGVDLGIDIPEELLMLEEGEID